MMEKKTAIQTKQSSALQAQASHLLKEYAILIQKNGATTENLFLKDTVTNAATKIAAAQHALEIFAT
ncbi:MAG: hypothetical protein AABX69_01980 [Nanoarchaeota archaeon]